MKIQELYWDMAEMEQKGKIEEKISNTPKVHTYQQEIILPKRLGMMLVNA